MLNKLLRILRNLFLVLISFIVLNPTIFNMLNVIVCNSNTVFAQSISTGINISKEELELGITNSGHSLEGFKKSTVNQEYILNFNNWTATNYVEKDILSSTYIVQLGDTLWEISEGYYGSGFNWVNILDSNRESIGYLNDGTQALIFEGLVLNL